MLLLVLEFLAFRCRRCLFYIRRDRGGGREVQGERELAEKGGLLLVGEKGAGYRERYIKY